MPNWSVGSLKVRGTKEEIISFLKGAFEPIDYMGENKGAEVKEDEYEISLKTTGNAFFLKGTRRHFIDKNYIEFYHDGEEGSQVLVLDDFQAAWGINASSLAELSKEFNVDLRIYAFERGMQFNQEIEIHKGKIVKDIEIKFDNYDWECINPNIGG